MRLSWATTAVALLLASTPFATADVFCDESVACEVGCCGSNNVCGTGPNYCSKAKCINSCEFKAECNPGNWPSQYFNSTKCPLNVCCSKFGFCGTTEEFCGKETVKRPSCSIASQSVKRVIGYYGSGGAYRSCNQMLPETFPQGIYTHIYFAFGNIDPTSFKVVPSDAGDVKLYSQLAALKSRDPGQELWLSIGGWTFSDKGSPTATTFSDLVNAPETRQNVFFAYLINFMQTWKFSGIDIDWEYPVDHDRNGRASDFKAYPKFLKRLKSALDDYKYGLSVTLPTSYWYLQHFDLKNIEPSVDWFNVMSYDLHGAWDIGNKWTGAFVGAHTNLTEIKSSLDLLWRNDVTPSKVVLGLSFYGRAVTLADPSCSEPGCPYLSAGDAGECSNEAGILFNNEISDLISEKKLRPKLYKDAAVKTIQWNDDQWVSYDDKDTWKLKANFLKSQCLSGVLVWAVDYDDSKHSYSKGLAAALGIKVDLKSDNDAPIKLPDKKDTSKDFCYFTNCGQTCPRGYTEIIRGDEDSQLMLDSSECDTGTQTLCCPKSSKVPKCRWRGHHDSGHCTIGCESGEVEVGTIRTGCSRSGWQSACCESTESTENWSKCAWTDTCVDKDDEKTCPPGYSSFVVNSREGWGGQRICPKGKRYNYCCSETPKAFKNCKWSGWEDNTPDTKRCTDSCPHGSTRIAEQQVDRRYGNLMPGHNEECFTGHESYCCAGEEDKDKDDQPTITYRDLNEREFDRHLQKFLEAPVCPAAWDDEYTISDPIFARDLLLGRATDMGPTLGPLQIELTDLIASEEPSKSKIRIWETRTYQAGYGSTAANISTLRNMMYQGTWSGRPAYSPTLLAERTLCDLAYSRLGTENVDIASRSLCTIPYDVSSGPLKRRHRLQRRKLDEMIMEDRSDTGQPSVRFVLEGILNGDLSLHYLRWLNPRSSRDIILEAAFWIGPVPGRRPATEELRENARQYRDTGHADPVDRWVVFHFHIRLDRHTFMGDQPAWYPGVRTFTMYHSQGTMRPGAQTQGHRVHNRVEYRYSTTVGGPTDPNTRNNQAANSGMRNFNERSEPLSCPEDRGGMRWYMGFDYAAAGRIAEISASNDRARYAHLVNRFGVWLHRLGTFDTIHLQRLWPYVEENPIDPDWGTTPFDAHARLRPVDGAYDLNYLPGASGGTPRDVGRADQWE
ncbi:hypothetical protein FOMG_18061 [Fusarium oxysporum f. sp. melonis 26406]|uniref:chitinase n=1 Tax=Fusarium oxysporum f. sp. melonis 26406 TaxID=1089452 RepID=W9Z1I9_FUSOX|nr:hypothetical protein FOMG_18061 [Fusarium oxysporum f. sp. melonis 26406]